MGFVLGLRHALDADHVVAVSTMVSETQNLGNAARIGGVWGLGHTLSLGVVGVLVLFSRAVIPPYLEQRAEQLVGLMLVVLGITTLWRLYRRGVGPQPGGASVSSRSHHHGRRLGLRPLLVGMVHGLAGSAALMLVILSTMPSPVVGLLYIALFGLGSVVGMVLVSLTIGFPLVVAARLLERVYHAVVVVVGLSSLSLGTWLLVGTGLP